MEAPKAPTIAPDPMFQSLANMAQQNEADATRAITSSDYGSLLARYGSLLSLAGNKGTAPIMGNATGQPIAKSFYQPSGMAGAGRSGA